MKYLKDAPDQTIMETGKSAQEIYEILMYYVTSQKNVLAAVNGMVLAFSAVLKESVKEEDVEEITSSVIENIKTYMQYGNLEYLKHLDEFSREELD